MLVNLKNARKQAGLSQKEIALTLKVAGAAVSQWENCQTFPSVQNLTSLANMLNVSVDYLLGNETAKEVPPPSLERMTVAAYVGNLLTGEEDTIERRIILLLQKMTPEQLKLYEGIGNEFIKFYKED